MMESNLEVIIEISPESGPVKYEYDKEERMLVVDRFIPVSMHYPCNYGFIPKTLGDDGDPIDVLVYSSYPIMPGAKVFTRAIGVLLTEDESGIDSKVLTLPLPKIDPMLAQISTYQQLPGLLLDKIQHFFKHYKSLENGKWVKVIGWKDAEYAMQIINKSRTND